MPSQTALLAHPIGLNLSAQEQVVTARDRLATIKRYLEQGGVATPAKIAEFATEAAQLYRLLLDQGVAQRGELDSYLHAIGAK